MPTIEEIHESLVNGQRRQMVEQIDSYGTYDFWDDYRYWLHNNIDSRDIERYQEIISWFSDCVVSYFRIKNR